MLGTISWLRHGRTLSVIGPGGSRTLAWRRHRWTSCGRDGWHCKTALLGYGPTRMGRPASRIYRSRRGSSKAIRSLVLAPLRYRPPRPAGHDPIPEGSRVTSLSWRLKPCPETGWDYASNPHCFGGRPTSSCSVGGTGSEAVRLALDWAGCE
jgi:hypothetical protein